MLEHGMITSGLFSRCFSSRTDTLLKMKRKRERRDKGKRKKKKENTT
jgi:hypothetical protein